MEKFQSIGGQEVDVEKRPTVERDDIAMHLALFQRDVDALIAKCPSRFTEVCQHYGITGDTVEEQRMRIFELFDAETHYKRRNKMKERVQRRV